jgi:signal transduction histidine kinase
MNDEEEENIENLTKEELLKEYREMKLSRDRVFTIASHDLRSPFSGLLGVSEMLVKDFDKISGEDLKKYLSAMNQSLATTCELIENLSEWGRIERRKYDKTIESIPLRLLLEEVTDEISDMISGKEIEVIFDFEDELIIQANSMMVEFVMKNLLSNAVKFSRRGTKITIGFRSTEKGGVISVKDQGIGISEENKKKLFNIDVNWKARGTEGEPGTGVGLLSSSHFAGYFGASIRVESTEGAGSTFSLILPESRA